jgi:cell division protein ZapA (FtsZ GTPase activity inhibitor)
MSPSSLALTVGRRTYRVAAAHGEEARLQGLAARVDALFTSILEADPSMDRDHILFLITLQLAADLAEHQTRLDDQATAVTRFHRQLTERLGRLLPPTN